MSVVEAKPRLMPIVYNAIISIMNGVPEVTASASTAELWWIMKASALTVVTREPGQMALLLSPPTAPIAAVCSTLQASV